MSFKIAPINSKFSRQWRFVLLRIQKLPSARRMKTKNHVIGHACCMCIACLYSLHQGFNEVYPNKKEK